MSLIIPPSQLDPQTLNALIEEFITRDGAVHGHRDTPLEQSIAFVRKQLDSGLAQIVYDEESESCTIIGRDQERSSPIIPHPPADT